MTKIKRSTYTVQTLKISLKDLFDKLGVEPFEPNKTDIVWCPDEGGFLYMEGTL